MRNKANHSEIVTVVPPVTRDRVCPHCQRTLRPLEEGGAAQAICHCEHCCCARQVRPHLPTSKERAARLRDSLRTLLSLEQAPQRLVAEVLAEITREAWTHLTGIDGEPFRSFEKFCADPNGLGTDPELVKALLGRLKGADAVALMAVPVARPGRRTDLRATSRRDGDRCRTPRTHTRLRRVLAGPAPIKRALERGALGRMNAERLVAYAKAQPNCPRLTAMVSELAKAPPKGSPELPKFKRALSKRIEHLLEETSSARAGDQQHRTHLAQRRSLKAWKPRQVGSSPRVRLSSCRGCSGRADRLRHQQDPSQTRQQCPPPTRMVAGVLRALLKGRRLWI